MRAEESTPPASAGVAKDGKDGKVVAAGFRDGKDGKVADFSPPAVTDANVMEVIANGNRRIREADGGAVIDLANMGDSDSTSLCAMLEWIAEGNKSGNPITFRNIPPRQTKMLALYQLTSLIIPHSQIAE